MRDQSHYTQGGGDKANAGTTTIPRPKNFARDTGRQLRKGLDNTKDKEEDKKDKS